MRHVALLLAVGCDPVDPSPLDLDRFARPSPWPDRIEDASEADFAQGDPVGTEIDGPSVVLSVGGTAGTFRSRVFDAERPVRVEGLSWIPDAPYGKPLPDDGGAEVGYPGGGLDLGQVALLMHFDEQSGLLPDGGQVLDSSGSGHDATMVGFGAWSPGPYGVAFDDAEDTYLSVPVTAGHPLQFGTEDFTWAYWLKTDQDCPIDNAPFGNRVHVGIEEVGSDETHAWLGCKSSASASCTVDDGTGRLGGTLRPSTKTPLSYCGQTPINDGAWHHVALVKEGHADVVVTLYVDGRIDGGAAGSFGPPLAFEEDVAWTMGAFRDGSYPAIVALDEVVVDRRAWSPDDVADAYRRNRGTLSLSVRGCTEADCSDDPLFSEAQIDPVGGTQAPVERPISGIEGRYVQYEVAFASVAEDVTPRLHTVALLLSEVEGVPLPTAETGTVPTGDTSAPTPPSAGDALPAAWFCGTAGGPAGAALLALIPLWRRRRRGRV